MRVKCITNDVDFIENIELRKKLKKYIHLTGGDDTLDIGREYIVQCIVFFEDCWYYYLHTMNHVHYPWSYPAEFFLILDNSLPPGWKIKFINDSGKNILKKNSFPAWVDDDCFFGKLYEDDNIDAILAYITNLERTQNINENEQLAKYTARIFGCELAKKLLEVPFDSTAVAYWCEQLYKEKYTECDELLKAIICRLSVMNAPQLAYNKEQLKGIADNLIHKFKVIEPEKIAFVLNDQISIKKIAEPIYRPGERGSLCWIQIIDSEENAALFGHSIGSEIYFVRFHDGEVVEIPKEYLIKHDFFNRQVCDIRL